MLNSAKKLFKSKLEAIGVARRSNIHSCSKNYWGFTEPPFFDEASYQAASPSFYWIESGGVCLHECAVEGKEYRKTLQSDVVPFTDRNDVRLKKVYHCHWRSVFLATGSSLLLMRNCLADFCYVDNRMQTNAFCCSLCDGVIQCNMGGTLGYTVDGRSCSWQSVIAWKYAPEFNLA